MKKKDIWIIPQGYPDEYKSNLTPFIKNQIIQLKNKGYRPIVLYIRLLPLKNLFVQKPREKKNVIENDGVHYTRNQRLIKGCSHINSIRYKEKLSTIVDECLEEYGKPLCLMSHFSQYSGYAAASISEKYNIPLVNIEHAGWLLKDNIGKYETKKLKFTYEKSKIFVCVSEALRESIKEKIKATELDTKLRVIPNMIENRFVYYRIPQRKRFIFFSAGNLYPGKRFPMLINAFSKAFSAQENVSLVIAGDGKERRIIERLIKKNKREQQIILLGALTREEMLKQYILCNCFVLPSEHETFGIVYREALAIGRPVITTDHQGFKGNLWDERFGIRIPIDDCEALVKSLIKMKNHSSDYNCEEISQICREKYAADNVINAYCDILENL